jgi:cbb3-type cytochrome c oxidase subunit III
VNTISPQALILLGLALFVSGCSQDGDDSKSKPQASSDAPTIVEMVKVDPALAAEGQKLYNQNCSVCHQADAIGKPGFAPSLTNQEFLRAASDTFIMGTVRDGRAGTGMPPFAHLGRKNIEAIVAFLRSHATEPNRANQINAQPHTEGDPRLGQVWFEQICSTCHGPKGDGYVAGGTGTAIGMAGFLNKASDGFIRETIKYGRSNTRMLGFSGASAIAALTDKEIDDIIAYLRTVPSKS